MMPLLSFYWKVHDAEIGILASCSKVVSVVVMSLAWNGNSIMHWFLPNMRFLLGWILFLGSCLGFLYVFAAIVIWSMLSKCVNKSDLGKIYSLLASLEAEGKCFQCSCEMCNLISYSYPVCLPLFHNCVHSHTGNIPWSCLSCSGSNFHCVWHWVHLRLLCSHKIWSRFCRTGGGNR